MIEALIWGVWSVGWVATIYPAYKTILRRCIASNKRAGLLYGEDEFEGTDIVWSAAWGTFLSMAWPIGVPFYISYALHQKGRRFDPDRSAHEVVAEMDEEARQRKMLKAAALEVESYMDQPAGGTLRAAIRRF